MDLNNEVHGEKLIQDTTINPKCRGGLLPSLGGEGYGGVGEGGEVDKGDSGSGPPPIFLRRRPAYSLFLYFDLWLGPLWK
jgi:hypothetical protein